jgi:putative oxidoreductase
MASNGKGNNALREVATLVVRLVLGVIFVAHGAQKIGVFGGDGLSGTVDTFQTYWGIPAYLTYLTVLAELGGGLGLIFGFLTRLCGLGILVVMIVAIAVVHGANGFWNMGTASGSPGFEFNLALAAMALYFLLAGAGPWSLDAAIWGKRKRA